MAAATPEVHPRRTFETAAVRSMLLCRNAPLGRLARPARHDPGRSCDGRPCEVKTMYIVIAGCGRVGSSLARQLLGEGHEVCVIDESPEALSLLGDDFAGRFVIGQAIDWETLHEARVGEADAYVTATDGDNTNIVSAQIAREHFGVRCSVARVFDPLRADLFEQTGIRTVCPTKDAQELLHEAVGSCLL
jgi:trk system potassium uptake protein TrkA